MKWTYIFDEDDMFGNPEIETYKSGDHVLVYSCMDTETGYEWYRLSKRLAENGYPGNVNSSVTRFHGWRGTTNGISVDAHGVYVISDVEKIANGTMRITLNKTDIKKDCP